MIARLKLLLLLACLARSGFSAKPVPGTEGVGGSETGNRKGSGRGASMTAGRRSQQRSIRITQQAVQDVCKQSYPMIPFDWNSKDKVLALTFDDGPEAHSMSAVLDVLRRHNIKATFFVNTYSKNDWLGAFTSADNKAAVRRLVSEGHELGSHAAEHVHLTKLTTAEIDDEINWAIGNITQVTQLQSVPLFRAPYADGYWDSGKAPNKVIQHLWDTVKKHHVHVAWAFSGDDYKLGADKATWEGSLFQAYGPPVVQQSITGVVLMHSTPNAMGGCPQALERVIQYWKDAGYAFVSMSHLVQEIYGMSPAAVVQAAAHCPPGFERAKQQHHG